MINIDVIIKIVREMSPGDENWPVYSRILFNRIKECLQGFPGLGFDDVSLMTTTTFLSTKYDRWIEDKELMNWTGERVTDVAPTMYRKFTNIGVIIDGIGCQKDLSRDPERIKYRWRDLVENPLNTYHPYELLLVVTCNPRKDGGPGYYYFYKAYRDRRP